MKCTFFCVLVTLLSSFLSFGFSLGLPAHAGTTPMTNTIVSLEQDGSTSFRCMRPFTSLPHFSPPAMNAAENCKFGPFRIVNASAVAECTHSGSGGGGMNEESAQSNDTDIMPIPGCRAVVRVVFKMEEEKWPGHSKSKGLLENDTYRFAFHLRALNDSAVHYKGFDRNGYSMCCDLLQEAECVWERNANLSRGEGEGNTSENPATSEESEKASPQKEPVVVACPLYSKIPQGGIFHGSIAKPLHRLVVTEWEARLEFWRGSKHEREVLGRLLLPFRLTETDIASFNESYGATGTGVSINSWTNIGALVEGKREGVKESNGDDDL